MVGILATLAENTLAKLPHSKGGHPKDEDVDFFISKVDEVYEQLTGSSGGLKKPFLDFTYDCLKHIGKESQSKDSLKQRRAKSLRKSRRHS